MYFAMYLPCAAALIFLCVGVRGAFEDTCEGRWAEGSQQFASDWLKAYCVCRVSQLGCDGLSGPERTNWGVWYSYKFTYTHTVLKKGKERRKESSITVLLYKKYEDWSIKCNEISDELKKGSMNSVLNE